MKELTPKEIEIRVADVGDAQILAEIGARTFIDAFGAFNTPENLSSYIASSFGPSIQAAELAAPDTLFLIATSSSEPAAYAKLRVSDVPPCIKGVNPIELERFYVESRLHGLGVSHLLMKEVLRHSIERGHDVVWLGVWEHNQRAIAFYRKCGFGIVGQKGFRLGRDLQTDHVMSRFIDSKAEC